MTIEWIIFDAMGVIFEEGHDLHELVIPFIKKKGKNLPINKIQDTYIEASLGMITSEDFWTRLGFGEEYPGIEKEYLDTCLKLDPQFIEIAEELKKEYSLGLLSNDDNFLVEK